LIEMVNAFGVERRRATLRRAERLAVFSRISSPWI
jgi:hypothetical protein